MGTTKFLLLVPLMIFFFKYGYAFSAIKVFPFNQILQAKLYLEQRFGYFEEEAITAEAVYLKETLLQRLLIKKIHLDSDIVHEGGMNTIDQFLYIVTNKGNVLTNDNELITGHRLPGPWFHLQYFIIYNC